MRNVLKILKRDLLRLLKTPQALVVVFALMVIPSLYTWYNVIGFWNPYDNTGNLTVCVVNQDAGGSSELTGELNVGERIVDQLHENNQLHWEFTDYDAAMNELKSGRAYAAYVIPEHFTADLLTITTGSFTQPKIEYYVNEKSGPVAPKITDTGATTLDETINSTFVATVSDVVVKTIDEKVNEGRESTKEMQSKAAQKISEAVAATGEVRRVLADLGDASKAAKDKAASAKETLSEASAGIDAADKSLGQMGETATAMQKTLSDFSAFALPAVTAGLDDITQASNDATSAAARLTAAFGEAQGGIQAALAQGSAAVQESGQLASSVRAAAGSLPAGSSERAALEALADSLDERTRAASTALDALTAANDRAQSSAAALSDAASALDGAVRQATSGASAYSTTLFGTTLPAVNDALDALAETSSALSGALETQRLLVAQTGLVIDQLDATMDTAASTVAETDRLFAGLESELGIVYNDVLAFGTPDALSRLVGEGGLDADKIAAFMASPTEVVTEQLYPLNAYGSAMAPLFMNLTFWIGAFMLLVIMRQEADGEGIPGLTLAAALLGPVFVPCGHRRDAGGHLLCRGARARRANRLGAGAHLRGGAGVACLPLHHLRLLRHAAAYRQGHLRRSRVRPDPRCHGPLSDRDDLAVLPIHLPAVPLHLRHRGHARGHLRLLRRPVRLRPARARAVPRAVHGARAPHPPPHGEREPHGGPPGARRRPVQRRGRRHPRAPLPHLADHAGALRQGHLRHGLAAALRDASTAGIRGS